MTTVVLVHGAWHGAWCFDRVVPLVRDAGIDVVAVDLPGHGSDTGPFTDLHGDAARVTAAIEAVRDDVLLVGHSYGGAVISEAGVHERVRRVVYLAAFALAEGETCQQAAGEEAAAASISHADRPDVGAALVFHDDGTCTLTTDGAIACLYQDCDAETQNWAVARLGPQPMATRSGGGGGGVAHDAVDLRRLHRRHDRHPDLQRISLRAAAPRASSGRLVTRRSHRGRELAALLVDLVGSSVRPNRGSRVACAATSFEAEEQVTVALVTGGRRSRSRHRGGAPTSGAQVVAVDLEAPDVKLWDG